LPIILALANSNADEDFTRKAVVTKAAAASASSSSSSGRKSRRSLPDFDDLDLDLEEEENDRTKAAKAILSKIKSEVRNLSEVVTKTEAMSKALIRYEKPKFSRQHFKIKVTIGALI
jgi:hypothetical protein